MKLVRFTFAFLGICCLAISLDAREVVTCKSPDEKFALRHVYSDQQPYTGDTTIIEVDIAVGLELEHRRNGRTSTAAKRRAEITLVARFAKGRLFCGEWERPRDPSLFPKR